MKLERKLIYQIGGLLAFAILFYYSVNQYSVILRVMGYIYQLILPFIIGGCIAFVLNLPMSFLERQFQKIKLGKVGALIRSQSKVLSLIGAWLFLLGILGIVILIVAPRIQETISGLSANIKVGISYFKTSIQDISWIPEDISTKVQSINVDWDSVIQNARAFLGDQPGIINDAGSIFASTLGAAASVLSVIMNVVIGTVFSVYILLQKESLLRQSKKIVYAFVKEEKADSIVELAGLANRTFSRFITGQCVEVCILGTMFFISMTIFGLPYPLVISVVIACLALIPIVGAFVGCGIGMFLIGMVDPVQALIFLIMFLVIQQIEGNIIYPRVVGGSVGLPAIWTLAAVLIGGKLMGVVGMIIFIPLCSVLYDVLKRTVAKNLRKRIVPKDKYNK